MEVNLELKTDMCSCVALMRECFRVMSWKLQEERVSFPCMTVIKGSDGIMEEKSHSERGFSGSCMSESDGYM